MNKRDVEGSYLSLEGLGSMETADSVVGKGLWRVRREERRMKIQ